MLNVKTTIVEYKVQYINVDPSSLPKNKVVTFITYSSVLTLREARKLDKELKKRSHIPIWTRVIRKTYTLILEEVPDDYKSK